MSIRDGTRAVVNDCEVLPVGTMLGSVDGSLGAEDGGSDSSIEIMSMS